MGTPTDTTETGTGIGVADSATGFDLWAGGWFGEEWREAALCWGIDTPHIFFPVTFRQVKWAAAYCQLCPVAAECEKETGRIRAALGLTWQDHIRGADVIGFRHGVDHNPGSDDPRDRQNGYIPPNGTGRTQHMVPSWFPSKTQTEPHPDTRHRRKQPRRPTRKCVCEWCNRRFKSTTTADRFWERGMFCSAECRDQASHISIETDDGEKRICNICWQPLPAPQVSRSVYAEGWVCSDCDITLAARRRAKVIGAEWAKLAERHTNPDTGQIEIPCSDCDSSWTPTTPKDKYPRAAKCPTCRTAKPRGKRHRSFPKCKGCGKRTRRNSYNEARLVYCSRECAIATTAKARRKTVTLECEHCRTDYETQPGSAYRRRYCTQECARAARSAGRKPPANERVHGDLICDNPECARPFHIPEPGRKRPRSGRMFCSPGCRNVAYAWRPHPSERDCDRCGTAYKIMLWKHPYAKLEPGKPEPPPAPRSYDYIPRQCPTCRPTRKTRS